MSNSVIKEALNHSLVMIHKLHYLARSTELDNETKKCVDEIESVMSLPVRNCDVGTASEQAERFDEFCDMQCLSGCSNCPCNTKPMITDIECFSNWSQMPYEEGDNHGR